MSSPARPPPFLNSADLDRALAHVKTTLKDPENSGPLLL